MAHNNSKAFAIGAAIAATILIAIHSASAYRVFRYDFSLTGLRHELAYSGGFASVQIREIPSPLEAITHAKDREEASVLALEINRIHDSFEKIGTTNEDADDPISVATKTKCTSMEAQQQRTIKKIKALGFEPRFYVERPIVANACYLHDLRYSAQVGMVTLDGSDRPVLDEHSRLDSIVKCNLDCDLRVVAFAFFIPSLLHFAWFIRSAWWRRVRRCGNCGYDIRASIGKCSECGVEVSWESGAGALFLSRQGEFKPEAQRSWMKRTPQQARGKPGIFLPYSPAPP